MSHTFSRVSCGIALAAGTMVATAPAQTITSTRVLSGLVRPVWVTHAPGDYSRVFVIEKQGRIRIAQITASGAYTLLPTSFLDIDSIVTGGTSENSEQGLLGMAFHPNYPCDPRFFVYYTSVAGAGDDVVASYTVSANPNVANTTGDIIMIWDDPQTNHNGGWIAFGPNDGYLYIASGDGGNFDDQGAGHTEPGGNAQDLTSNRLGKIHRIDVNGDDFPADANADYRIPPTNPFVGVTGDDEIWAYGLRNPWRPSFDRGTGDLYIADVGQNNIEEISFQPATGTGIAGRNYGWRCYEGNNQFNFDSVCQTFQGGGGQFTFPIYTYTHGSGCSITGGYVYRGCAIPDLQGTYFFADYCTAFINSFRFVGGVVTQFTNRTAALAPGGGLSISAITSFGEDAFGEMYICDSTGGEVFKIIPAVAQTPDCNANSRNDTCDILARSSRDTNHDGVPDECQTNACSGDLNGDLLTDVNDLALLLANFGRCRCDAGFNPAYDIADNNFCIDLNDLTALLADFGCNHS